MLKKLPPDVDFNTIDILKQLANTNRALVELRRFYFRKSKLNEANELFKAFYKDHSDEF